MAMADDYTLHLKVERLVKDKVDILDTYNRKTGDKTVITSRDVMSINTKGELEHILAIVRANLSILEKSASEDLL